MGTGFPGGNYAQIFYVADVEAAGPAADGELHVDLDQADFLAVFPLTGQGRARLVGTVRDERAKHPENLKFEDVSQRAIENLKIAVENRALVLDLSRASPRRGAFPQRPRFPAGRRRAYP